MEKRIHPRSAVSWPLSFSGQGLIGEGTLVNMSMGGCWAQITTSTQGLTKGIQLTVCLLPPDDPSPLTVSLAEVRCTLEQQVVIEFIYMKPKEAERLERFLEGTRGTLKEQQAVDGSPASGTIV